jgi:hypothetical protein
MKQTRLKPRSLKKQREIEETQEARLAFRREMVTCCLCKTPPRCVHEIYGGKDRPKTVRQREFWLACCWDCHLDRLQYLPKLNQLAIKLHVDSEWCDVDAVNELIGAKPRNPNYMRAADVAYQRRRMIEDGVLKSKGPNLG